MKSKAITQCSKGKKTYKQGRNDGGGYWYLYRPKSAQVNFLWGKNDVRTAIQQFYTPQNFYTPKTNFWLRPACKYQSTVD